MLISVYVVLSSVVFPKMFDEPLKMFSAISIDLSMHAGLFHFREIYL